MILVPNWRFPDIGRCAGGGFRHVESEFAVKNCQFFQLELKTWTHKFPKNSYLLYFSYKFQDSRHAQMSIYAVFHEESEFAVKNCQFFQFELKNWTQNFRESEILCILQIGGFQTCGGVPGEDFDL